MTRVSPRSRFTSSLKAMTLSFDSPCKGIASSALLHNK